MLEDSVKICIPVQDEKGLDLLVYGHFGSAPFFAVYDTDTKNVRVLDASIACQHHGCH
jgi:predicted Fe-Mo cluster-binding NifX family protein